jgi:ubiquinone biosynthesis protein
LRHRQSTPATDLQRLIEAQTRTQRLLFRVLWGGLGFILGLIAMQVVFQIQ